MATSVYLTSTAADAGVTGGSGTKNSAQLTATSGTSAQAVKVTSASTGSPLQFTDGSGTTDGTVISWYTPSLSAVTISGALTVNFPSQEDANAANTGAQVTVERCNSAGTVLSTVFGSTSAFVNQGTLEAPTTTAQKTTSSITPTSTTLSSGDRLRITVWLTNASNQGGTGTQATGHWEKIFFNGSTTTTQIKVNFAETLTAVQTVSPSAIGSAEAIGSSTVTAKITLLPTAIQLLGPGVEITSPIVDSWTFEGGAVGWSNFSGSLTPALSSTAHHDGTQSMTVAGDGTGGIVIPDSAYPLATVVTGVRITGWFQVSSIGITNTVGIVWTNSTRSTSYRTDALLGLSTGTSNLWVSFDTGLFNVEDLGGLPNTLATHITPYVNSNAHSGFNAAFFDGLIFTYSTPFGLVTVTQTSPTASRAVSRTVLQAVMRSSVW